MSTNRFPISVPMAAAFDELITRFARICKSDASIDRLLFVQQRVDRAVKDIEAQLALAAVESSLEAKEACCEEIRSILASALYDLEVRQ